MVICKAVSKDKISGLTCRVHFNSELLYYVQLTVFQTVLRELEQKKPHLDELVKTAENLRESPIKSTIPTKGEHISLISEGR